MNEQTIAITEEEQTHRNKLLRMKKWGMSFALFLILPASSAVLYLLQAYEHTDNRTIYIMTGVMTVVLLVAFLLYKHFIRKINLDMQSDEKIVTTGTVVRSNFIGNNIYPSRIYGRGNQKYLTLDVDGRWVTLSGLQIKRLLPHVSQLNHVLLHDQFIMEYTPYGRHLMRMEKI